jgi:hypothetical protein
VICIQCKHDNKDSSKFCGQCGSKIITTDDMLRQINSTPSIKQCKENLPPALGEDINCLGRYKNGYICSSGGASELKQITINSYWKGIKPNNNENVLFSYSPKNKTATNVRAKPIFADPTQNYRVEVKGGVIPTGRYIISTNNVSLQNKKSSKIYSLYGSTINITTEERAREKLKSVVIGAVGAIATLGVGLVVGILHASKKFLLIEVTLSNGDFFIAECRPDVYQKMLLTTKYEMEISQEDYIDSITAKSNTKNIEEFYDKAKNKELIFNVVGGLFLLLILLAIAN